MPKDTRRGFLRGLMNLPLIRGGITLMGAPSAVAEPVKKDLLYSYKSWLQMEHRMMCFEMFSYDSAIAEVLERSSSMSDAGAKWHFAREAAWPTGRTSRSLRPAPLSS